VLTLQFHYSLLVCGCVNHVMPYLNYFQLYIGLHKRFHNGSRDSSYCLYVWERTVDEFHGLVVHLLIHLVDEVELVGVVSCHWMLFLERYIKKLKFSILQMEKLENYMVEGYISYESLCYASDYIKKIDKALGVVI